MQEEIVLQLKAKIRGQLDMDNAMSDADFMEVIERNVFQWSREHPLTAGGKVQLVRRLFHAFRGLDLLQPLMDDPTVTEIMINSHEEMFIERAGKLMRLSLSFESRERLEDLIQAVVAGVNRVVNESSPIVDARLKDGSRVHIVLPPVALKGPTMTIRKFPEKPLCMKDLIALGALTEEAADLLRKLVSAKYNVFISGGTGSGKTTFLNALSQFIPADERIVTIEDSAELQIASIPNLVSLETRNANTEGKGEITMRELIKASLRMRPNRIIIGEVRGGEAIDMLQAMNTGHDGSLSTGHANSARDMMARLETMVLSGAELPIIVIRQQISSAIDIVVHLSRMRDRSRRVTEICEITGLLNGEVSLQSLYRFEEEGEKAGRVIGALRPTGSRLQRRWKLQMAGLESALGEEVG
ncbi:CpaF family protein [Paenibacillus nasutitermitis]|uniref:Type II/IV secretion system protein n=1 Tax=Paenibacillus nasutitermitis TaxID=1652958 RepID=A0A916Z534_9BACL|nr:CpaF family protein [Paenibacillus nasutitermitis]GGD76722.1 type II/IV secretion system protein [Paenibacillus nasutitermitis]